MNTENIKTLLQKGLILTPHAKIKMQKEYISKEQIINALLKGIAKEDKSIRNNKAFAWNNATHYTVFNEGLTVVFCDSKEHACLIISVYHGKAHDYLSNPHNQKQQINLNGQCSLNDRLKQLGKL